KDRRSLWTAASVAADALVGDRDVVDEGDETGRGRLVIVPADRQALPGCRDVRAVRVAAVVARSIRDADLGDLFPVEVEAVRLLFAVDEPLGAVPLLLKLPVVAAALAELAAALRLHVEEELVIPLLVLHRVDDAVPSVAEVGAHPVELYQGGMHEDSGGRRLDPVVDASPVSRADRIGVSVDPARAV